MTLRFLGAGASGRVQVRHVPAAFVIRLSAGQFRRESALVKVAKYRFVSSAKLTIRALMSER